MEVRAQVKYARISPKKVQAIVKEVRGKKVEEALRLLSLTPKKGARMVKKVLESAIGNAKNNFSLSPESLWVKNAWVDRGPMFKRIKPRAMGRADLIRKRTSHITVILSPEEGGKGGTKGSS